MRWDLLGPCRESLLLRKAEAGEIERISRETLPLLEEIRDNLSDQRRVNRAIAQVDELRAKMDAVGRTYDQVMQFSQQTELKRFERDRLLAAGRLKGFDRQKSQVDRDIENVQAVIAAAELFSQAMTEAAEELGRQLLRRKEAA